MSTRPSPQRESWQRLARRAFDTALNFILPPVCVSCGQAGDLFCVACRRTLTWFSHPFCPACGHSLREKGPVSACNRCRSQGQTVSEVRAVCAFEGAARDAIHALKYDGYFAVAEPLAQLMVERFPQWLQECDSVIAVPLHPERIRERGYNQSELLAQHLCRQHNLYHDEEALWRTRNTRPQIGLDRAQRRENVKDAFAAHSRVRGRHVLLVDDVCTTGATLIAAGEALLSEGAASVRGFCFARPATVGVA